MDNPPKTPQAENPEEKVKRLAEKIRRVLKDQPAKKSGGPAISHWVHSEHDEPK